VHLILEACVDSVESAKHAERHGAHRLELCGELHLDGTTPGIELIQEVLNTVQIPVKVMVRPRGGDFVYDDKEFQEMLDAISLCKALGIPEIATGILKADKTLDIGRIEKLAQYAAPIKVTIHKCIDLVPDLMNDLQALKRIPGVTSLLSSGQAPTALLGADLLKQMQEECGETLTLIVAGKVTQENLTELRQLTGAREFHGRQIVG
jgi:copper homeostasis protein